MILAHVLILIHTLRFGQCGEASLSELGEEVTPLPSFGSETPSGPAPPVQGIEFNVSSPSSKLYEFDVAYSGIEYKFYSPKNKGWFKKVFDGTDILWEEESENTCNGVRIYRKNNELVMLVLSGDNSFSKYFKRDGQEWKSIDKDEHDSKLKEMEDPPQTTVKETEDPTDMVSE